MLHGAFALVERSFRINVRSLWPFAIRFWLMVWIYAALCIVKAFELYLSAPGMRFFQSIGYLDAACLTLVGIGFFSSVITEEKEDGSLGLILMAGVSPLGVLLGKSISGCWQAILLIAVQYPFLLLAITMGGVAPSQVSALTTALMAYVVFLAGFGLFCSTVSSNSRNAARLMTVSLIGFTLLTLAAGRFSMMFVGSIPSGRVGANSSLFEWKYVVFKTADWISNTNIFLQMGEILTTGSSDSMLTIQTVSNVLAGLFWVGASWLLFGRFNRTLDAEAAERGLLARRRGILRFPPGRVSSSAFLWKDFHFVGGGWRALIFRTLYFPVLAVVASVLYSRSQNWLSGYLFWVTISIVIDASMAVSRSMREEIRCRTLPTLMTLPRPLMSSVYEKLGGALIVCLPGILVELWIIGCTKAGHEEVSRFTANRSSYEWLMMACLLLVPQMSAVMSLYLRRGAVAISAFLSFVLFAELSIAVVSKFDNQSRHAFSVLATLFVLAIAGACHLGIYKQIHRLASQ